MDKNTLIGIIVINILFLFVPFYVNAKTVTGVGEYEFGADITENQSCASAKTKAEADAIERAFGSTVGAIDWEMCDNNTCDFNSLSWSDTFGQVMVEAMASGLPVAAYPVTGPKDVILDDITGCLNNNLHIACSDLMNIKDRRKCIEHSKKFTWDIMVNEFIKTI